MTAYCVVGNPGAGKSLVCVGRIRDAIAQGRRVATNLNLRLEHLTQGGGRTNVLRIPDLPTLQDLELLGNGNPTMDASDERVAGNEDMNGLLVIDESSGILDSRQWQDPKRRGMIDWLKHHRKHGWDLYFIVQHESMLDAQVRKAFCEMLVVCKRMDRLPIPMLGWLLKLVGFSGRFMRAHLATVRYGGSVNAVIHARWFYRGNQLFAAYDTRQIFRPQTDSNPQAVYQCLDRFTAPWLADRRDRMWRVSAWLLSRPSVFWQLLGGLLPLPEPGSWYDFWMAEKYGPPRYQLAVPRFSEWAPGRAGRPGALGAAGGEAPEPERHLNAA